MLVLGLAAPAAAAATPDPDLGGEWHLDTLAGGTTPDTSSHNLDGTVTGSPAAVSDGRFGAAVHFPAKTDVIDPGNFAPLQPRNVTLMAWVRSSTAPGTVETIVAQGAAGQCGHASYALYTGGSLDAEGVRFYIWNGTDAFRHRPPPTRSGMASGTPSPGRMTEAASASTSTANWSARPRPTDPSATGSTSATTSQSATMPARRRASSRPSSPATSTRFASMTAAPPPTRWPLCRTKTPRRRPSYPNGRRHRPRTPRTQTRRRSARWPSPAARRADTSAIRGRGRTCPPPQASTTAGSRSKT